MSHAVASRDGDSVSDHNQIVVGSLNSQGEYQSDLLLEINSVDPCNGIVNYIKHFGEIYRIHLDQAIWSQKFNKCLHQLTSDMLTVQQDQCVQNDIEFKLNLINQARNLQHWRFPGVMESRNHDLVLVNGHSRLLAAGISWADAWEKMDFIVFVPKGSSIPAHGVRDITIIHDDAQLRTMLHPDSSDEPATVWAQFYTVQDLIQFRILGIGQKVCQPTDVNHDYLHRWLEWRSRYQGSQLEIQCFAGFNTVIDSSGLWQIVLEGPPPQHLPYYSNMTVRIHNEKKQDTQTKKFQLYHFGTSRIDLAEVLLWLDTDYSVFHTDDWSTIFVQPGEFKCQSMSISKR